MEKVVEAQRWKKGGLGIRVVWQRS